MIHRLSTFGFLGLILLYTMGIGCGSESVAGDDFTLDVEGNITVTTTAATIKSGIGSGQSTDLNGTSTVAVAKAGADALVVGVTGYNASGDDPNIGTIQLVLDSQGQSNGSIFKRDSNGNPLGISSLIVQTNMVLSDGQTLALGGLLYEADTSNPNQLPLLGDNPILEFVFDGQNREAQISNLMIILTPQIIDDL